MSFWSVSESVVGNREASQALEQGSEGCGATKDPPTGWAKQQFRKKGMAT